MDAITLPSIGLIYNAEIRNNGTPRRVQDALVRMGAKDAGMVRYNRPPYEDIAKHDFWLFVDDGRDDIPMSVPGSPNACWLIDSHLGYDQRLEWAREFDHVFLAQKPSVERMQQDGIESVHWLPLACHPPVDPNASELRQIGIPREQTEQAYDVCFIGYLNTGYEGGGNNRTDYLNSLVGGEGEFDSFWVAFGVFFQDAAARYVKAKVGFNISITNDLNMRFFEVMSYGVCLVTNTDVVGWDELGFVDGVDFVGYKGKEGAIEAVRWCLEHPIEREHIAKAGHKKVRNGHTYQDRVLEILEVAMKETG